MDCLFCAIAAGEIPSVELYQDGTTFAFLDINPLAPGHALVVPKAHAGRLEEMDGTAAGELLATARRLLPAIARETGLPDATLAFNNGPAAGQEVGHVHLHVIPRGKGDGVGPVHALFPKPTRVDNEELHDLAIRIQRRL